jgi:hypothetical protein
MPILEALATVFSTTESAINIANTIREKLEEAARRNNVAEFIKLAEGIDSDTKEHWIKLLRSDSELVRQINDSATFLDFENALAPIRQTFSDPKLSTVVEEWAQDLKEQWFRASASRPQRIIREEIITSKREIINEFRKNQQPLEENVWLTLLNDWNQLSDNPKWENWASSFLEGNIPYLHNDQLQRLYEITHWINTRVWPQENPTLRSSFVVFGEILHDLLEVFYKHAEPFGDMMKVPKFYHSAGSNYTLRTKLEREHSDTTCKRQNLTLELTRTANLISDLARQLVNTDFRIREGKFSIIFSRNGFDYEAIIPEFNMVQKQSIDDYSLDAFCKSWGTRDIYFAQ